MLTLLFLAVALSTPAPLPAIVAPEVMVSIAPSSMDDYQLLKRKTPETYTCTAMVRDAESKSPWLSANLVLLPGQRDKVSKTFGDYALDFSVDMTGARAEATVTVKRGDKMLTRQRSTVYLRPVREDRIVPLH